MAQIQEVLRFIAPTLESLQGGMQDWAIENEGRRIETFQIVPQEDGSVVCICVVEGMVVH